ncbi:MAG: DUF1097 domain-containing protein [Lachnospiraceae bacterium]|nr:DUF1097 domain-containing protein [Lachnospiraceae bacterium]MDD3617010.1 DUF1097 domain-containing protein [Lachnospiraceae bacterium]
MNKKMIKWAVWIAVWSGVYCFLYALSPLYEYGIMWNTFVALPIFFTAGAKKSEYFNYVTSMLCGIVWGVVNIAFVGVLTGFGIPDSLNMFLSTGIITAVCCILHFTVTSRTWLNKIPMMFGAIACTFNVGISKDLWVVAITMFGGITLGLICQEGFYLLDEDGKWDFSGENVKKIFRKRTV